MDRSGRTRFDSWKEIASYLTTSVRTVQRWEKDERLPVHRHAHARQDTVYAYQDEIDAWRADRDRQITKGSAPQSTEMAFLQAELAGAASAAPAATCRSPQGPFLRREDELRILQANLEAIEAGETASDAGLIESQVDAICGAALALFNLKRTSETRALGLKALELARLSTSETAVASSQIVLAMERMCLGDFDAAEAWTTPALPVLQSPIARRFRCT
jgi:hypothetical protein